jgi:hypothetical protein
MSVQAERGAEKVEQQFVCVFVCLFRRNVELKKVNSKYILKSTLTPQLSRKQFHSSSSSIERCQSWPNVVQTDSNSEMKFCLGPVSCSRSAITVCDLVGVGVANSVPPHPPVHTVQLNLDLKASVYAYSLLSPCRI